MVSLQPANLQDTHKPDGREIDVNPIIKIIEFILRYANATQAQVMLEDKDKLVVHGMQDATQARVTLEDKDKLVVHGMLDVLSTHTIKKMSQKVTTATLAQETLEDKDKLVVHGMLDVLSTHTIKKISQKMSDDSIAALDANATTMDLLTMLSKYTWDAKVALTFAAFAVNYAGFLLITELYPKNSLAKSIALLKESVEVIELSDLRKSTRFGALNNLIKAMLDVTNCLVEFEKLSKSIDDIPYDDIPCAAYETILSLVACGSQIISLTNNGYEYIRRMEEWDLLNLGKMVRETHKKLQYQLDQFHKPPIDSFEKLESLFVTQQLDNLVILNALINPWNIPNAIVTGSTNEVVTIEEHLKGKNVLLFISDHKVSQEEVDNFEIIYNTSKTQAVENQYEVVWLPIIDRSIHFNEVARSKSSQKSIRWPWFKLDLSILMLEPWVVKYIKEEWHFEKKPILVALDPQGKLVSPNALPMMLVWGDRASPFAHKKEELLWQEEPWPLIKLLMYGVLEKNMLDSLDNWKNENKVICLYGGKNIDLIRNFTCKASNIARAAGIALQMYYVGSSNNIADNINEYNMWPDDKLRKFFWARLESIRHSKRQLQFHKNNENDPIMQGVLAMLSYDASDQEWAVMSDGSAEMVIAEVKAFSTSLSNYKKNLKKNDENDIGFLKALNEDLGPYGKITTALKNQYCCHVPILS